MNEKIKILVADDNPLLLKATCQALERAGFEVLGASEGLKVYQEIIKNKPDVVLLDIMMPEIDGIEICRNLKRAPRTKDILVVIYSSKTEPELIELAHTFGADAYLIKNQDLNQIISRVKEIIHDKLGKKATDSR